MLLLVVIYLAFIGLGIPRLAVRDCMADNLPRIRTAGIARRSGHDVQLRLLGGVQPDELAGHQPLRHGALRRGQHRTHRNRSARIFADTKCSHDIRLLHTARIRRGSYRRGAEQLCRAAFRRVADELSALLLRCRSHDKSVHHVADFEGRQLAGRLPRGVFYTSGYNGSRVFIAAALA